VRERGSMLSWSTDGPVPDTLPPSRDPNHLMGLRKVQELLLPLCESPRTTEFVDSAAAESGIAGADLVAAGILRQSAGRYSLAFPLLTASDVQTLRAVTSRYGETLADAVLARRREIEETVRRYPASHVPSGAVAFIALGCISLDRDGLSLTEELGYRAPFRTGGVGRVHWATVRDSTTSPRGMYWGSHSDFSPVHVTTFGDHFSRATRAGFPDLAWAMARASQARLIPQSLRPQLERLTRRIEIRMLAARIVELMMSLRDGPQTASELGGGIGLQEPEVREILALLEEIQYLRRVDGRYAIVVPVFAPADREMVQALREIGRETMTAWLAEHSGALETELAQATPVGVALPFQETFYYVWHYLFGTANRMLVERGLFADPYAPDRTYQGFIPAVWHEAVLEGG